MRTKNSPNLRLVYTVAEAAELLGIGRSTAYDLVARGELPTVRLGHRVVVSRPALTALLGFEPPLPGELDTLRSSLSEPRRNPSRTTARRHQSGPDQPTLFSA